MNLSDLYIRYWCDVTLSTSYNNAARGYLRALAAYQDAAALCGEVR